MYKYVEALKLSPKHTKYQSIIIALVMVASFVYVYNRFYAKAPEEEEAVNALLQKSNRLRYRNIDESEKLAKKAYCKSGKYKDGKSLALIEMADINCLRGNINLAKRQLLKAGENSNNIIVHFKSRVGLLKVCQLASANIEFNNYLYEAQNDIKRIKEEFNELSDDAKFSVDKSKVEMHLTSAEYYANMQQVEKAEQEFNKICANENVLQNINMQLRFFYSAGCYGLKVNPNRDEVDVERFDNLAKCILRSSEHVENMPYLQIMARMALAELLSNKQTLRTIKEARKDIFDAVIAKNTPDSVIALTIAQGCVEDLRRLKNPYLEGIALCTQANCEFEMKRYKQTLATLKKSLEMINLNHRKYGKKSKEDDTESEDEELSPTYREESTAVELKWINDKEVYTIPEWIARVRERLSMTYSALNDKVNSDYNRNIYLDILDITREDKMLESRYSNLKSLSERSTVLLVTLLLSFIAFMALLIRLSILWTKRYRRQTDKLRNILEMCHRVETREMTEAELESQDNETKEMLKPFFDWMQKYDDNIDEINDESINYQKQQQIYIDKVHMGRRNALYRNTVISLAGCILTYIDRLLHTIRNVKDNRNVNIEYANEIIAQIEKQNKQLTELIKISRGQIKLNIQSFELDTIFNLIEKSRLYFKASNITLNVSHTDIVCKADYALTVFMVNTLTSNAKKFTKGGGEVNVYAEKKDDYVEISVSDTGVGMSQEDVDKLMSNKVYDPKEIGSKTAAKNAKGFGFGIQNCKGIINQYYNSSPLMKVCSFGIESELGKGSRFFFRLPYGIKKAIMALLILLPVCGASADNSDNRLVNASLYSDSAYYCNVNHEYKRAITFGRMAIRELNAHYQEKNNGGSLTMKLIASGYEPEIYWYKTGFYTDYHVILDIRNEVAVAALALHEWELYAYNNMIFTKLFKLVSHDSQLEEYCRNEEKAKNINTICIVLLIIITIILLIFLHTMYFLPRIRYKANLKLVGEIGQGLLEATRNIPNDLDEQERLNLLVSETDKYIEPSISISSCNIEIGDGKKISYTSSKSNLSGKNIFPLKVLPDQEPFGYIEFTTELAKEENNTLLIELISQQFSACSYHSIVAISKTKDDRELAYDEMNRSDWEQQQIYVNNQILDNCLSTIKHETMIYPTQIRQQINKLADGSGDAGTSLANVVELTEYYRNLFFMLLSHVNTQSKKLLLKPVLFDSKRIAKMVLDTAKRIKRNEKVDAPIVSNIPEIKSKIYADPILIEYLFYILVRISLKSNRCDNKLFRVSMSEYDNGFVKFEVMNKACMSIYSNDDFDYMLATEIIKEHDEQCRRGCKFEYEYNNGETNYWFTLPTK